MILGSSVDEIIMINGSSYLSSTICILEREERVVSVFSGGWDVERAEMAQPSKMTTTVISKDVDPKYVSNLTCFLDRVGVSCSIPDDYCTEDFYSNIIGGHVNVHKIELGHVICHLSVTPAIANFYGGIHGGAVAAISKRVAIACVRTVIAEDKEIFLAELSTSYLSAAPKNVELIVDGSVVRSGRNVTVVAIEFKFKKTGKLSCTSRATFFNTPVAKL